MNKVLIVEMGSGRTHQIARIRLFPERLVVEAADLMQKAASKLQGTQLGLGFFGSPAWALAASAAVSAIESWVNRDNAKEQLELISTARRKLEEAARTAKYVSVEEIESLGSGMPGSWRWIQAPQAGQHSRAVVWVKPSATEPTSGSNGASNNQVFIHNGSGLVDVELLNGDPVSIVWSHVESISLRKNHSPSPEN